MEIIRNYIATLDSKKRLTLRKTDIKYYEVKEYDNGCIVLEPRKFRTDQFCFFRNTTDAG